MKRRVLRGGSYYNVASGFMRTTDRGGGKPGIRSRLVVFRIVVSRRKP